MERFEIWRVGRRRGPPKDIRGPRQQLLLPFGDLRGMDLKVLRQFGQRLVAFDRRQGHLGLKCRSVIPSCSLHRLAPLVRHHLVASVKPGYHLPHCPNFRSPLSLEIKKDLSEKLWKIILKDGEVEFHSLDKDKLGCYLSSSLHTVDGTSIGTTYTFPAEVAKIIPSQQGWIKLKNLPKDTFSHLKEETISKLAREAILVSGEAKEAAARAAVLVTNRRQDAIALRTADKEPVSKSIENWETLRSVHLPWVSNLSVEEVLQLRDKAGDALPKFRDRMNRELFRISENDSRDKVSIQVTKALREEANELDADLRAAAKKTGHAGHIGIAVTGISCIIYGVGANIPALAGAGAALTTALCSMYHPSKNAHAEYAHLKTRSAYVLLSAREIIRRRKHA